MYVNSTYRHTHATSLLRSSVTGNLYLKPSCRGASLGIHYRGVHWDGGAVDGGSTI